MAEHQAADHLHISTSLDMPGLQSIAWDFQFWFLDSSPQENYLHATATGSSVDAIYACKVNANGGTNQIQATVTLTFAGQAAPAVGHGSAVFTCVEDQDTTVDIVIALQIPAQDGYPDIHAQVVVVSCWPPQLQWKGDDWLAVCGDSSCGDSAAALLFSQQCEEYSDSSGAPAPLPPKLWSCGPADWSQAIDASTQPPTASALSQFAVPGNDGQWVFGVAALAQVTLAAPDLSLTDSNGRLVVHDNVPTPTATLIRQGGAARASSDSTRVADWAVELSLPAGGSASSPLLAVFRSDSAGTHAGVWQPFGACDAVALGQAELAGLYAVDVRLVNAATLKLFLSPTNGGVVTQTAICAAIRAADGTPQLSCSAPGPIS